MNIDRMVFVVAGTVVLLSVLLSVLFSPWWLLLTTFVGINMLQAAFTGFCPAAIFFAKLGVRSGCAFEADSGRKKAHS